MDELKELEELRKSFESFPMIDDRLSEYTQPLFDVAEQCTKEGWNERNHLTMIGFQVQMNDLLEVIINIKSFRDIKEKYDTIWKNWEEITLLKWGRKYEQLRIEI